MRIRTSRLDLDEPAVADLDELYAICSDPQSWTHFPSLRHTDPGVTERMVQGWSEQWRRDGLSTWMIRERGSHTLSGYGGCSKRRNAFWNLGYRLHSDAQGNGYAAEMCEIAVECAHRTEPELPIVAYLLEHNVASARVAERAGLELITRGPDVGNPDVDAIRVVYADRALTADQVGAVLSA
ncbi:GNAT family N-acetyltransferase [Rhodococcus sp. 14-2496-1d]|uniref:GNAT family N-acetyltransferase n=1 Tax=Rhodococcus sp. 14-2496-1d TaxID=2023146 RepID=UPI000B9A291F|nr:GNAT family N-acetyltransferase [Rhodococcus sp. 14-2496-1d]OZF26871.1 GNAT family N-acetyltransferase [Rhodococcus sp. 14-2496-1d]